MSVFVAPVIPLRSEAPSAEKRSARRVPCTGQGAGQAKRGGRRAKGAWLPPRCSVVMLSRPPLYDTMTEHEPDGACAAFAEAAGRWAA